MAIDIRQAAEKDWPEIWKILQEAFATGDTYPYPPDISEADARRSWVEAPELLCVAEDKGNIVGVYYLKPNMPGLGSHICNCGYIVSKAARGQGVGKSLCNHSLEAARTLGYRGMQFNLVVSTNENAVGLWKAMGFEVIGTVPEGFEHATKGYVDALIMYQKL
ncbi:MAG: GNAT family N-acetyltransferase [Rhodospirillaceae bacterium]|nr:GNAT family N-acetyltransferase [Rhodospirillaceae bacterium]|tara:strand:- start:2782 stop:3270 length:489 start_codon:yes stop_codon:yes gene_type:complete